MSERFYYFYDLQGYTLYLKELRELWKQDEWPYRIIDVVPNMNMLEEVKSCKRNDLGCVLVGIEKVDSYEGFPKLIEELATHKKTPIIISYNAKIIKNRSPIMHELLEKHWCSYGEGDRGFYQTFGTQKMKSSV
ncbi:hypothetical protein [Listeria newyorkensis]|uniref:hypothetical protein n=1 Tax=Listeria newyorkensis TaxID=1497681 RepID=UPI00051CFBC8|nr:hypothetical protein [Listeria newyorkensis]KGL43637.1 hypothetical protein EP58_07830 [Listeria newyorkensis]